MITAIEAREKLDLLLDIAKCETQIEPIIKKSAEDGFFETYVDDNLMFLGAIEALEDLGYKVDRICKDKDIERYKVSW